MKENKKLNCKTCNKEIIKDLSKMIKKEYWKFRIINLILEYMISNKINKELLKVHGKFK